MDYTYPPYDPPRYWSQTCYRNDRAKLNLLWLVHPVIDTLRLEFWQGDEVSTSIDRYMSTLVREMLSLPPREFVIQFLSEDRSDYMMTQPWPENWPQTMHERAVDATNRLRGDLPNNVFAVDFERRVRYA